MVSDYLNYRTRMIVTRTFFKDSFYNAYSYFFTYNINNLTYIKKYAIIYIERDDTMRTINITNARQNLFQLASNVNIGFNPITIVNNKGKKCGSNF